MDDFEKKTDSLQKLHFEFLECKEYDVLPSSKLHYFRRILSNYIPAEERVRELSKKIICSSNLYYRVIIVNIFLDERTASVPVICIRQNENKNVFYDIECRKYEDWEDFLSNNHFPKCLMKFPENGVYKMEDGKLKLGKRNSPASSNWKEIHKYTYHTMKMGAILASVAPDFELLKPYNQAIAIVSGICNAYTGSHHAYQLYDRYKHDQTVHPSDGEAGCHWINLGSDTLLFGVTLGKMKYGSPQSETVAFQNILSMSKLLIQSDNVESNLRKLQTCILGQHLTYFSDQAVNYFHENIIHSSTDVKELLFNIRRYVLGDSFITSKHRRFADVDLDTLSTVARDTALARDIPRLFQTELYNITIAYSVIADKIMQEIKHWVNGNTSDMQLLFQVSGICKGYKVYETLEDMCKHFEVSQPEDIQVNGKYIFRESGRKFLELVHVFDLEKFPQLLSYTVEYLGNGNDNLEEFKKHFNKRISEEMDFGRLPQVIQQEKEWINALTLGNLSFAHSVPHEGINLVKPKTLYGIEIVTLGDLFKLARRLLGRVGSIDMKMVRQDVNWIVVVSKQCKYAVIVAPELPTENFGSVGGCYPVFKRPL